jgi:hypothetical protein
LRCPSCTGSKRAGIRIKRPKAKRIGKEEAVFSTTFHFMLNLLPVVSLTKALLQPEVENDKEIAAAHFPNLQFGVIPLS